MKFYIASRCQEAARAIRDELQAAGHTVTSRWLEENNYGADKTDAQRMAIARIDHEDVIACDYLVFRSEPDGSRVPGGKHVEMGMALALHRPVFVIGARENIFHWHPSVHVVGSVAEVLEQLTMRPTFDCGTFFTTTGDDAARNARARLIDRLCGIGAAQQNETP